MTKSTGESGFTLFTLFTLFTSPLGAQPFSPVVKRLDMSEAVRLSQLNNPALLASLEEISIVEQHLRMARHLNYPQFGFDALAADFRGERNFILTEGFGGLLLAPGDPRYLYMGRGTIEQNLYTGGRTSNAIILAKAGLEKAQTMRDKTARRVIRDVRTSFERVLYMRGLANLSGEMASLANAFRPSESESAQARLAWEELSASLDALSSRSQARAIGQSNLALLRAIGMDLSSEVDIVGDLQDGNLVKIVPSPEQTLSWAREYRPEYKAEALESEMDATQVAIALASRNPVISLAGMYELLDPRFPLRTANWAGMIRVHLPFSWDSWNTIRERRAQQRKGQVRRVEIDDAISLEVRQAHADLVSALAAWERQEKRSELWKELYPKAVATERSLEGKIRLFERYVQARLGRVDALHDALRARYEFEHAVGRDLE